MKTGRRFGRGAVLMGVAVLWLCGLLRPGEAQQAKPECVNMLQERQKIVQAMNDLNGVELPSDKIRDMQAFIEELKSALGSTGDDAGAAAKKIEDAIDKLKRVLPQSEKPLREIAKGLKDGKAKIEDVVKAVDQFAKALAIVDKLYEQTEGGSAADQVKALGSVFKQIESALPVEAVPGLGSLFDAYRQSIDRIAQSVARIEDRVKDMNATMRELQRTGGDELGIVVPVYLSADGPREKLAKQKQALDRMLKDVDDRLDAGGCMRPGSPLTPDYTVHNPCSEGPDNRARIALKMTQQRIAERGLDQKRDHARDDMMRGYNQMRDAESLDRAAQAQRSDAEAALGKAEADRDSLQSAIAAAKAREAFLRNTAGKLTGAERESWENKAKAEWEKYTVWEQRDLPQSRKSVANARRRLQTAKDEAGRTSAAYESAKARLAKARANLADVERQIADIVAGVIAQASKLEKWNEADRAALTLCQDRYFPQQRVKAAVEKALAEQTGGSDDCRSASADSNGGGLVGRVGRISRQIDALGCR